MEQTYTKRSGTTNKGLDYEVLGIANYAIDLVTDQRIKNFNISSNHPDFGAFDDIVIETEEEVYAIQLKHSDKGTLTLKHLSNNPNFSIKKYFHSAQSIKAANVKFILYTNLKFNFEEDTKFCIKDEDENFLIAVTKINTNETVRISEKTDFCYKFSIVKDTSFVDSVKTLLYDKFFENFFLYTDQENSHNLNLSVTRKFKSSFCGSDIECDQYLKFLREWSSKDGKIEKLNKERMTLVIALKVFSSRLKPLALENNVNIESTEITRRNILREAIDTFDVSIFGKESYDELKKLWVDAKNELTDLRIINKLRTKYHLDSNIISDISKADSTTRSVLLWLMDSAPLILTQDASVQQVLKLCAGKKILLLEDQSANSFMANVSVFKTLVDLKAKTTQYEQLIQNFSCSLQGKDDISLENLVRDKEDILTALSTDDLLKMVKGKCLIGEAKERLPEPYVDRCLSKNAVELKILDNLSKETVVILDCVSQKPDLRDSLTNHNLINVGDCLNAEELENTEYGATKFSNSCTIYLSEQRFEYDEFIGICNTVKNAKNFHQLRLKNDGNLEWIRSSGDVSDIEKYKLPDLYSIKESNLNRSEFRNTINLLASDPGMGKSELMKSFKIKSFSEYFTVIVNPKDTFSFLENNSKNSNVIKNADAFLKLLLDEKYKTLSKNHRAILHVFLKHRKIIIVWDALDELLDEHRDIVSDIIVGLSRKFHQWVTSRRHLLNILQKKFNVLTLNLNKFEEHEQKNYIQNRLAHLDKTETIETTLEKISSSFALVEHKDILGIPLQIFMLTELFRQDKATYSALLDNFFLLTDLYHYFIEEKVNIHFLEKLKIDLNSASVDRLIQSQRNQILKLCTKAALRLLFPDEILTKMGVSDADNFDETCENHENIGLIPEVKDNVPRFIHNSFAEYLAARHLSKQSHRKDILTQVMFDPKYTNVRFFFDLFLARDSKAHVAILYKNFSFIKDCDSKILTSTDLGGRTVLHLACSWGQRYPELEIKHIGDSYVIDHYGIFNTSRDSNEYLEAIDCLLEECDIYKPDEIYNMTAKEYARRSKCLPAEMRIDMKQNTENLVGTDHLINLLYYSAHYGYHDELAFYFKLFEQDLATEEEKSKTCRQARVNIPKSTEMSSARMGRFKIEEKNRTKSETLLRRLVSVQNNIEMTLIFIAAKMGHLKIVEILFRAGIDINLPDKYGATPLYIASENAHKAVVEMLLKVGAGTNLAQRNGWTPLHMASLKGHETIVDILVKAGVGINLLTEHGATPLYIACHYGHKTVVDILLKADADANLPNKNGWTPLHTASWNGHETIVDILLKVGVDIHLRNEHGATPLYLASHNGHATVVDILLKAGIGINVPNKHGATPLFIASENAHKAVVELLLEEGADPNLAEENGLTPLHMASRKGRDTVVATLLKAGVDIHRRNEHGATPLYVASHDGHETVVDMLLKAGIGINIPNKHGATPLFIASENAHKAVVEILLEAGADPNLAEENGLTPLHMASRKGRDTVVDILLKAGVDKHRRNEHGATALYLASHDGHKTVVDILLKAGIGINIPNKHGATPLFIASENAHKAVVELLLEEGADPNLAEENGWTPLHMASRKGHETIVDILLKAGVGINLRNEHGATPLYVASRYGHQTVVDILLKAGVSINLPNKHGATPLYIASEHAHKTVVEMLLKAGAGANIAEENGLTPLHMASLKGHDTVVDILLKADVGIHLLTKHGATPLYIASHYGHKTVVDILLKAGISINLPNKYGATPLYVASQNGHTTVVEILLKAGADANLAMENGRTPLHIASHNGHGTIVEILQGFTK